MTAYMIFLGVSAAYIAMPGPGVVLTLTNAARFGFRGAVQGIAGISAGMLAVGVAAATGIAALLAVSAAAFAVLKVGGAVYLVYIGIRHLRLAGIRAGAGRSFAAPGRRFIEGLTITMLNPKATLFYLALFPQFIDSEARYLPQFLLLATSFSVLLIVVHLTYASAVQLARGRLETLIDSRTLGRFGGGALIAAGTVLAATERPA